MKGDHHLLHLLHFHFVSVVYRALLVYDNVVADFNNCNQTQCLQSIITFFLLSLLNEIVFYLSLIIFQTIKMTGELAFQSFHLSFKMFILHAYSILSFYYQICFNSVAIMHNQHCSKITITFCFRCMIMFYSPLSMSAT